VAFLENEGEGVVELLMRAEPDIFCRRALDIGLEDVGMGRPHPRIDAVGANNQIVVAVVVEARRLGFKPQFDAQFPSAALQDVQQTLTPDAGKT